MAIPTSRLTAHTCVQTLPWGQNPNKFSNIAKKLHNCPFVTVKWRSRALGLNKQLCKIKVPLIVKRKYFPVIVSSIYKKNTSHKSSDIFIKCFSQTSGPHYIYLVPPGVWSNRIFSYSWMFQQEKQNTNALRSAFTELRLRLFTWTFHKEIGHVASAYQTPRLLQKPYEQGV